MSAGSRSSATSALSVDIPVLNVSFYGLGGRYGAVQSKDFSRMVGQAAARLERLTAAGDRVALVYRTGPALLALWFAAIATRRVPLIVQYPTEKQLASYWVGSIRETLKSCSIRHLLIDPAVLRASASGGLSDLYWDAHEVDPREIEQSAGLRLLGGRSVKLSLSEDALFLQQSSGTTGHRKGIEYRLGDVMAHIRDFNRVVGLSPQDCVVSWLPLYHDMGFIACFLMPMLLGARLALIDPMDWVADKEMLLKAIAAERGTVCYMPNFGFEVMSGVKSNAPTDTVRLWVSSSEPTRAATMRRFAETFHVPPERMASCYAMAENIFAVTFRRGVEARAVGAAEAVNCGAPIPGVDIALRDGEIFVKSDYAIRGYIDSDSIRDADGYYATGDLGEIIDGELYVTGRKADLINQAGQKFLLSDIDLIVNETFPWVKGRVAATAMRDKSGLIDSCRIFIETGRFFDQTLQQEVAAKLRSVLPIANFEVVLMPATLIVKTSSGKVNRRETAARWAAMAQTAPSGTSLQHQSLSEILPGIDLDAPILEAADSLGLLIVEMTLGGRTLSAEDRKLSIRQLEERYLRPPPDTVEDVSTERSAGNGEYRIAVLSDPAIKVLRFDGADLAELEQRLGRPVRIDYVCMPPARVILQYLTFLDWFASGMEPGQLRPLAHSLGLLRSASLIVADDQTEMAHHYCAYPVFDFGKQRGPLADLLVYRYQNVAQNNHQLPISDVLLGEEIPFTERGQDLENLGDYLGVPVLRVAIDEEFSRYTRDWEHQARYSRHRDLPDAEVASRKAAIVEALGQRLNADGAPREGDGSPGGVNASDQTHYCCFVLNPRVLDAALDSYSRFLFFGPEVNFQQFLTAAEARGKTATRIGSLDASGKLPIDSGSYDCVVQAGPWYAVDTSLPVVRLMHGHPPDFQNIRGLQGIEDLTVLMRKGQDTSSYEFQSVYVCETAPLRALRRQIAEKA